jgi:HEAT repeat protein
VTDDKAAARPLDALNARGLADKREYVRGLERRRDAEALALLVECLSDESAYLRVLAEDALLRIGEGATPVLLPLLNQGLWYTRSSAARVLGRLARRDSVPGLLRLAGDANASVRDAAREALVMVARHGGAAALARALNGLPPDPRRRRFEEIAGRDRPVGVRLEHMMRNQELMAFAPALDLADDSPLVRLAEDGFEWEVLAGPARDAVRAEPRDGPDAGRS